MRRVAFVLSALACAPAPPPAPAAPPPSAAPVATGAEPAAPPEIASTEAAPPAPETAPAAADAEPPPAADPPPPASEPAPPPSPAPAVLADPRDPRKTSGQPRARALLVAELQALERLFQVTRKQSPDRAVLMRRLAEGYVELEHAAEREADGAKIVAAARKKALEHYLKLRREYPSYAKLDEVLYYAGYEHERAGDLANARALYRELAQKFPGSPFRARVPAKVLPR